MSKARKFLKASAIAGLVVTMLSIAGCTGNVGVGMSVGVPIGDHGFISVGTGRHWY